MEGEREKKEEVATVKRRHERGSGNDGTSLVSSRFLCLVHFSRRFFHCTLSSDRNLTIDWSAASSREDVTEKSKNEQAHIRVEREVNQMKVKVRENSRFLYFFFTFYFTRSRMRIQFIHICFFSFLFFFTRLRV